MVQLPQVTKLNSNFNHMKYKLRPRLKNVKEADETIQSV